MQNYTSFQLFRRRRGKRIARLALTVFTIVGPLLRVSLADPLPDGPGKAATVRVCGRCHSPERAASVHQGRSEWEDTMLKMVKLGAQGSDEEFDTILGYLSRNFGPDIPAPLNINKATAVDLQTALVLRRSQAYALIQYRSQNGDFRSIDDLRNVPGIDFQKIQAKKSRIVF